MPRFSRRSGREVLAGHPRLPDWIVQEKVKLSELHAMKTGMRDSTLHTVCEEARCPNRNHCFTHGTATFLLMGDTCTRACGFCAIQSGQPAPLNPLEPEETSRRVAALGLRFAAEEARPFDCRLFLRSRERCVEIGLCIAAEERRAMAPLIAAAISQTRGA